jgi:hypothetical protein
VKKAKNRLVTEKRTSGEKEKEKSFFGGIIGDLFVGRPYLCAQMLFTVATGQNLFLWIGLARVVNSRRVIELLKCPYLWVFVVHLVFHFVEI